MARTLGLPLMLAVAVVHAALTHSVSAAFVRGPGPSMSLDNNNQTQRIAELEQQLAELRHSLEVCAAADKSSPVQVAAQQYEMPSTSLLSKDTLGSREKPARTVVSRRVEDLVVNREITSYNWGNRSAQRRLTDDELDKKPVIGICLASTSKSKRNRGSGFDAIPLFKVLLPSLVRDVAIGVAFATKGTQILPALSCGMHPSHDKFSIVRNASSCCMSCRWLSVLCGLNATNDDVGEHC